MKLVSLKKKIKILYVSSSMGGGIVTVIENLLKYFNNDTFLSKYLLFRNQTNIKKIGIIVKTFFKFKKSYLSNAQKHDIIHFHGAWRLHMLLPLIYDVGVPTLISLHGALHKVSLRKSKVKKLIIKQVYMKKVLLTSNCIHALSVEEAQDIRDYGINNVPIAIIPNGIDMHENLTIDSIKKDELITIANGRKILLSLSRLHEAKGIDMLINAFAKLYQENKDNVLFIVGNGSAEYKNKLKDLILEYNLTESVFMLGEMFDDKKNTIYEVADIFILPSFNEGFGLTVLEALRQYTPVITTNATPFQDLESNKCGWYIKPTMIELYDALKCATNMKSDDLQIMGKNGYAWVQKNYSLDVINKKYETLYLWLTGKRKKPDFLIQKNMN